MSTKRYVTTWTSEDSVDYRLYIIPSNANYASGSTDVTLPSDFLLRDMSLDTELGELPAGMQSQVLKLSFNIAALQGTADLNNLRIQLLKGTTTQKFPLTSTGTDLIGTADGWWDASNVVTDKNFDCFNTFVLQYNDGSGYKVIFIGCQKYSAENEIEVTTLQNIIRYDIEAYDIVRCIGESIKPSIWQYLLRCDDTLINFDSGSGQYKENEQHRGYILNYYFTQGKFTRAVDSLENEFYYHASTFERLQTKISNMYSAYLRAITQNYLSSYVCNDFFTQTYTFFDSFDNTETPLANSGLKLSYIAEIWHNNSKTNTVDLVSGAHADVNMFAEYKTFYDVLRSLNENMLEIVRYDYTTVLGNPDRYTITASATNPYPATSGSSITFARANTYDSFKVKLLSETLQNAKVAIVPIKGESDTESYEYGEGAEGSMSKDMKHMFHNYTLLTDRNEFGPGDLAESNQWYERGKSWFRRTINPGTLITLRYPALNWYDGTAYILKVSSKTRLTFGAQTVESSFTMQYLNNPEMDILLEQRNAGSGTMAAKALVEFYGRKTQTDATLKTTFVTAKPTEVGKRCIVNFNDYNTLLTDIYSVSTAKGVMYMHSHDIYGGTVEISIRIDGESV
jgi:hypothetical protein